MGNFMPLHQTDHLIDNAGGRAHDRYIGTYRFRDRARINVDVNDLCCGTELRCAVGHAVVKARPNGNDQIGVVHDFIRARLERRFGAGVGRSVRLLYGGSVKPENAASIFAVSNVDGALVGGASLKAADFSPIVSALEASA